ncbi:Common plant regulatory factor [Ancistrocladus abbreviatus]
MGDSDEGKPSKANSKSSPPAVEQTNVHDNPDWAAIQAYYGPRVALPPYFNPAVASGHPPPPYMWGPPQPMIPPYGAPYAAIYSHGGVYAHPAVPLGAQSLSQGLPSSAAVGEAVVMAATPLSMDKPLKSSGNTDQGLIKKLKGFDGLAMSIGNGNAEKTEGTADNRLSQSAETEGSSEGSDGNTEEADQKTRKRSHEGTPTAADGSIKTETKTSPPLSGQVSSSAEKILGVPVSPVNATGKFVGMVLPPSITTTLELRNPGVNGKANPASVPPTAVMSSEAWLQNERELKRERRKQSNRESARRSRLRKQAETEDLARRVESLNAENMALKSEINELVENSEKLRSENASLMEKLKRIRGEQSEGISPSSIEAERVPAVSTENLLSRVNNSSSTSRKSEEGDDVYERNSNTGAKLHQLLDKNPRADAVAAG